MAAKSKKPRERARRCTERSWCPTMAERLEPDANSRAKGLHVVVVLNIRTVRSRVVGVAYRAKARERAMMLNVCPWCGADIDYVKRGRTSVVDGARNLSVDDDHKAERLVKENAALIADAHDKAIKEERERTAALAAPAQGSDVRTFVAALEQAGHGSLTVVSAIRDALTSVTNARLAALPPRAP